MILEFFNLINIEIIYIKFLIVLMLDKNFKYLLILCLDELFLFFKSFWDLFI